MRLGLSFGNWRNARRIVGPDVEVGWSGVVQVCIRFRVISDTGVGVNAGYAGIRSALEEVGQWVDVSLTVY